MPNFDERFANLGDMIRLANFNTLDAITKGTSLKPSKLKNGVSMHKVKPNDSTSKVTVDKKPLFASSMNQNSPYNLR